MAQRLDLKTAIEFNFRFCGKADVGQIAGKVRIAGQTGRSLTKTQCPLCWIGQFRKGRIVSLAEICEFVSSLLDLF